MIRARRLASLRNVPGPEAQRSRPAPLSSSATAVSGESMSIFARQGEEQWGVRRTHNQLLTPCIRAAARAGREARRSTQRPARAGRSMQRDAASARRAGGWCVRIYAMRARACRFLCAGCASLPSGTAVEERLTAARSGFARVVDGIDGMARREDQRASPRSGALARAFDPVCGTATASSFVAGVTLEPTAGPNASSLYALPLGATRDRWETPSSTVAKSEFGT